MNTLSRVVWGHLSREPLEERAPQREPLETCETVLSTCACRPGDFGRVVPVGTKRADRIAGLALSDARLLLSGRDEVVVKLVEQLVAEANTLHSAPSGIPSPKIFPLVAACTTRKIGDLLADRVFSESAGEQRPPQPPVAPVPKTTTGGEDH